MNLSSFFQDYLIPSGITIAVLTYLAGQFRGYRNNKESLRSRRLTLIDKLANDSVRINALFESLRIDAELNGYFAFKNINAIRPVIARIGNISSEELSVFDEKDGLSEKIIETGEFLSSLLTDVDNLETIANSNFNEEKAAKEKLDNKVNDLRDSTIGLGFQITPFPMLEVVSPSKNRSDKRYNAILSSLSELRSTYENSMGATVRISQQMKDRRMFYCIKLLDAQNRLKDLDFRLEKAERKYSRRNMLLKILNKVTF